MKQILLILLILPFTLLGQKYQKGTILFKNGTTLNCLLKPPSDPSDKKIETKVSENAEKVSYKSEELKSLTFHTADTTSYEFVWESTKKITGGLDYGWLYVYLKGYTTLYGSSQGFKVNKKGELMLTGTSMGHSNPDFGFYARRPGENYVTMIGIYSAATFGIDNYFRKASSKYFSDNPELVKRINNKEFELTDILNLVTEYNEWKIKGGGK